MNNQDGRTFSSRVLSDGTLRALALVTLKNDPQHQGVLCFEEPENGVHPFRLKNLVEILIQLATDLSDPDQVDEPLRQLLVNSHSPILASQPALLTTLLFAHMVVRIDAQQNSQPMRVIRNLQKVPSYKKFENDLAETLKELHFIK